MKAKTVQEFMDGMRVKRERAEARYAKEVEFAVAFAEDYLAKRRRGESMDTQRLANSVYRVMKVMASLRSIVDMKAEAADA